MWVPASLVQYHDFIPTQYHNLRCSGDELIIRYNQNDFGYVLGECALKCEERADCNYFAHWTINDCRLYRTCEIQENLSSGFYNTIYRFIRDGGKSLEFWRKIISFLIVWKYLGKIIMGLTFIFWIDYVITNFDSMFRSQNILPMRAKVPKPFLHHHIFRGMLHPPHILNAVDAFESHLFSWKKLFFFSKIFQIFHFWKYFG